MNDYESLDNPGLVEPSPCPMCSNNKEVFAWGTKNDYYFACIRSAREEHYKLFPENRPISEKAEDD